MKAIKPTIEAWHFLKLDMCAQSGDEGPWLVGETRTIQDAKSVRLCGYGYHSSPTPRDALSFGTGAGAMLCRVLISEPLSGDGTERQYNRKSVSASRKLVACADITSTLRLFAIGCADRVLSIFEKSRPNDERVRRCLEITRAYLRGAATIEDLRKARSAAYAAYAADAYAAAAAYATAYAAYAAYAAAADADAYAAAADAAAYAAAAADAAAYAVERKWQAEHLDELLRANHPELFAAEQRR